jgi:hypothetical protein
MQPIRAQDLRIGLLENQGKNQVQTENMIALGFQVVSDSLPAAP